MTIHRRFRAVLAAGGLLAGLSWANTAMAGAEVVAGPATDQTCMVPWSSDTKFHQFPKKDGPYRIALANGYIANTWRI
jgi:ribose transport system substrate-binding protein